MIKSKIISLYPTLTRSEKKIADYILDNELNCDKLTSYDLATEVNVSQPTIIRFSQKLGFSSFNFLAKSLVKDNSENSEITRADNVKTVNEKIAQQYINIINITNDINAQTDIDTATEYIKNAKIRVVFGVGTSALMCNLLCRKLNKIGFYTMPINGTHIQKSVIANLTKDDVVIFISQSGETAETTEAAMITKKLGIKTICITTATKNRLSSLCDISIKTTGMNDNIEISPTTLKVSQMFAIDMLFLNLIKEDKDKYNELLVKNGYIKNRY